MTRSAKRCNWFSSCPLTDGQNTKVSTPKFLYEETIQLTQLGDESTRGLLSPEDLASSRWSSITPTKLAIRLIESGDLPLSVAAASIIRWLALISSKDMYVLRGITQPSPTLPISPNIFGCVAPIQKPIL